MSTVAVPSAYAIFSVALMLQSIATLKFMVVEPAASADCSAASSSKSEISISASAFMVKSASMDSTFLLP